MEDGAEVADELEDEWGDVEEEGRGAAVVAGAVVDAAAVTGA